MELARLTGKPKSEISRLLSIQNTVPEVRAAAKSADPGTFTRRHMIALATLVPEDQREALAAIERDKLNAVDAEEYARQVKAHRLGASGQRSGRAAAFRYETPDATVHIRFRRPGITSEDIQKVLADVEAQLFTVQSPTAEEA
jgi:hypothetical protein